MSVPIPGYPVPLASVVQTKKDVATLEKLVDEHDITFLLMNSRESRWLPTVLGTAKGKIVLNTALGFDTYLVMRQGAWTPGKDGKRLGCAYCNDIVAPSDVSPLMKWERSDSDAVANRSSTGRSTRCAR